MSSLSSIVPWSRLRMRSLQIHLNATGRLLPNSASVGWNNSCLADLQWWSVESHLLVGLSPLDLPQPGLALYTDASDLGWGAFLADDHLSGLWSPEFSLYSINRRELLAVLYGVRGFLPVFRSQSVSLFVDNMTALSYLRNQGGYPLLHAELCGTGHPSLLRGQSDSSFASVCFRPSECPRLRVDPLSPSVPGASPSVAGHHRPVHDFVLGSSPSVLLSGCRSAVSGHGRHDTALGWSTGVYLPSLRPAASCDVEGSGAHPCGSVLASTPLVSGPSGASGGCSSVPSSAEGSTQTAPLPSLSPKPPRASSDCISYLERSARSFRFSLAVAR